MKKKVFYLFVWGWLAGMAVSASADVIQSDLRLLNGAPDMDEDDHSDPQWDLAWHAKLAEYGDPDSQFFIANVYEQGHLVPRNRQKAITFYKKAAQQNHVESCMRLGQIYRDEAWGTPDLAQSFEWYLRAAEQNYAPAQILISKLYEAKKEYDSAIVWLEKAMRQLFPHVSDLTTVSPELERLYLLRGKAQ